ncbi:hypothetical protein FQZ97_979010 [compost metagenome]
MPIGDTRTEDHENPHRQPSSNLRTHCHQQIHACDRVVEEDAESHGGNRRCDDGVPHALVEGTFAEESEDGDRSDDLGQDYGHRADTGHPGKQRVIRVELPNHERCADQDHTHRLDDRRHVWGLLLPMGVAERHPDKALATQDVEVASDVVVKGHKCCK